ncbi:hypothetical protein Afil01_33270 [Actinorhabdospora filicis]|uniref:Uncharacterized protein n=1 Tax=Actinorhabdospora filicis TaxID=1785913 RepID=A0A9W6SK64_9ACTN|nr:hypothetical protein [Actinorhabdospora filicis]GLZ78520.1 hypothetical protein Afil01_33270 [Actinorhabdospora filicis]
MGSRVHYILIADGRRTLFTRGGGSGYGFDVDFAVGPDVVFRWLAVLDADGRFSEPLPEADADHHVWLGDLSCEGAILIDADRRELLLYWSHAGTAYRVAMLDGYARTWPGWRIEWAFDGLGDLLARIGHGPAAVRDELWSADAVDRDAPEPGERFVVSRAGGGVHGLGGDSREPWWYGVSLLDRLPGAHSAAAWGEMPDGGMHLDEAARTAVVWSALPLRGLRDAWERLWPGWRLELRGADVDAQIALCGGLFAPPPIDLPRELKDLVKRVVRDWPIESVLRERGVDIEFLREIFSHYFEAGFTVPERDRAVSLLLGG